MAADTDLTLKTIQQLDALSGEDPEAAHSSADEILRHFLTESGNWDVAEAYDRVAGRCRWWGCS